MFGFIKKFLGDNNESEIRRMRGIVSKINDLEPRDATAERWFSIWKKLMNLKNVLLHGESLDSILPESFCNCT